MNRTLYRTLLGGNGNFNFSLKCLTSFTKHCKNNFSLEIFEDGSLTAYQIELLEQMPNTKIVFKSKRDGILTKKLVKLPNCRNFRENHVFALKILDTMIYDNHNFYYIDSDIIFFRDFKFEENYPEHPVFMKDIESSYAFSPYKYFTNKWKVYSKLNAGCMFFPKELFKLEILENIIKNNFSSQELENCWAEQTMWALLASCHITYRFDSKQIVMANSFAKLKRKTIAIHLTTPYRYKINKLVIRSNQIKSNRKEEIINRKKIVSYLNAFNYLSWMFYNKLQRKAMRLLSEMPKNF